MKHVIIPFEVKNESVNMVKDLISEFIAAIKKNESGTVLYKSFQQVEEPTKFVHAMTFADDAAEEYHRQTEHCQKFVSQLYPLCTKAPEAKVCNEIA